MTWYTQGLDVVHFALNSQNAAQEFFDIVLL